MEIIRSLSGINMKTKLVTGYWMDANGYPFRGAYPVRKERYLGSLKAHCENTGLPVVCYTHERSFNEVNDLKTNYRLDNLEIKLMELSDMKLHKEILTVRDNGNLEFDGRGTEILWGKLQVLEYELEGFDRVYWIDAGLQHPGIFPWRYSKKHSTKEEHSVEIPYWWADYEVFNFKELINEKTFEILDNATENKMMFLTSLAPQTSYDYEEWGVINYRIVPPYPIGGLFGGDTKIMNKFIQKFWEFSYIVLGLNHLRTEESIMKLVYDELSPEEKINFLFYTHATNDHDKFHFEDWDKNDPKPLYMVWIDILNYNNL